MNPIFTILAILAAFASAAYSQTNAPGPQPSFPAVQTPANAPVGAPPGPGGFREKFRDKLMAEIPPEMRQRFEAARDKALQDPKIQELKQKAETAGAEFRAAMREAMTKADPELASMLKNFAEKRMGGEADDHRDGPGRLNETDRQRLMAAREKAKTDPAVQAAAEQRKHAKTPEERAAANEAFHKAMRNALLKADPTIAPLLDQMRPPKDRPPGGDESQPAI